MTIKILALTDALGKLVRFVLLPRQRYDTVGVAPLIAGVQFDALIADKAFDANWIIAELNRRGAGILVSQRPNRRNPLSIMAPFDRELLLQAQGVQAYRPARRQNRSELPGDDPSRRRRHQFPMNLNRPKSYSV